MSSVAARLPTFEEMYAEIEALPQGTTGEILGPGEIRLMSRPARKHRLGARRLLRGIRPRDLDEGGRGWWIEVEVEIRLPNGRLYVPDLAGWRVEEPPDFVEENPITVVPDWACEILSRTTQRADRVRKLPNYAAAGVRYVWVVDPDAETIEVYETRDGRATLEATAANGATVELPPFGLPIDVGALWELRTTAPHPGSDDTG